MTPRHPARAAVLAIAAAFGLAAGLAGCGSGSSGSSTGPKPAGRAFIPQLNAACRADIAATRAVAKTVAAQSVAQQKFITALKGLTPSTALEPVYSRYLSALEQNLAAFQHHSVAGSKRLEAEIKPLLAELRAAGATAC